jgi:hypothetical protein
VHCPRLDLPVRSNSRSSRDYPQVICGLSRSLQTMLTSANPVWDVNCLRQPKALFEGV